jgi:hypothetical protein
VLAARTVEFLDEIGQFRHAGNARFRLAAAPKALRDAAKKACRLALSTAQFGG